MDIFRDEMYRLSPEKAVDLKMQYEAQLDFQKEKLKKMKARKARLIKKLDSDILKLEEDIGNTESVIETIKQVHFNGLYEDE